MSLPSILSAARIDDAAEILNDYFTQIMDGGAVRSGAKFNDWAGGGDCPATRNRITADVLVAVSSLGVDIPGSAAINILERDSNRIEELLVEIPWTIDLGGQGFDNAQPLGPESPANELWRLLTSNRHIGDTKASKIMARKRPHLFPIYDSVVGPIMGLSNANRQWVKWNDEFAGGELSKQLGNILSRSTVKHPISQLRVLDIVLWLWGMRGRPEAGTGRIDGREQTKIHDLTNS